jgi:hypothetical protein
MATWVLASSHFEQRAGFNQVNTCWALQRCREEVDTGYERRGAGSRWGGPQTKHRIGDNTLRAPRAVIQCVPMVSVC